MTSTHTARPAAARTARARSPRVAVVGAGASGIALAARLRAEGIDTFTVFEKSDRVGGTWRDNTYPGLYCDVPSRYYSFSFAPSPDWSRVFAPGTEIRDYLERVVDDLDLRRFIQCSTGVLRDPKVPDIAGLDDFAGAWFHSARWDHDVRLAGQRVGVIGTGRRGDHHRARRRGRPPQPVRAHAGY